MKLSSTLIDISALMEVKKRSPFISKSDRLNSGLNALTLHIVGAHSCSPLQMAL
ncbi:MAG TPA: hypothetical protein V6D35_07705 [Candidatus Sericytochromatia bacterium]